MAEISVENQRLLEEIVASGRFRNPTEALDEAIRLLKNDVQQNGDQSADKLTPAEWCDWFEAWAASHPRLPHEADDSRESIYAGRGE